MDDENLSDDELDPDSEDDEEIIDEYSEDDIDDLEDMFYDTDDVPEEELEDFLDEIMSDPDYPEELAAEVEESSVMEAEAAAANVITNDEIEAIVDGTQSEEEMIGDDLPLFPLPEDELARMMENVEDSQEDGYDSAYEPAAAGVGENPSQNGWYEFVDHAYVLSEDTTVDTSKVYYVLVYVPVEPQEGDNPSNNGWYVMNDQTGFVLTDDLSVKADTVYYRYNGAIFEPSPDPMWYDPADDNYSEDDDS